MQQDDEVLIDPELELDDDERDDDDDEEELSKAEETIVEFQREFIGNVQTIMEPIIAANPEHRGSIEATAEGIVGLIEGNGRDEGYILVKRTEEDLAMVPCTRAVYEEHLRDFVDPTGLDLSVGLSSLFNDINS